MAMAVTLGDCSRDDADLLRRAMGSKRGVERIESVKQKLYAGMAAPRHHRRPGRLDLRQDPVLRQLRLRRVARPVLRAARLRLVVVQAALPGGVPGRPAAQPADGLLLPAVAGRRRPPPRRRRTPPRRHALRRRRPTSSRARRAAAQPPASTRAAGPASSAPSGCRAPPTRCPTHRRDGALAVRLGLDSVRGIGLEVARRIVAARDDGPFTGVTDLSRRAGLTSAQLEALATAGAFDAWGLDRREALWAAGFAEGAEHLPGTTPAPAAPTLPGMSEPRAHPGRPVGHGRLARPPPGRAPARRAAPRRRPLRRRAGTTPSPAAASTSAGWSPTGSGRAPPWASPSSTSRTRPACSTSSARSA